MPPEGAGAAPLVVDLIDGTYELFRQFHGRKRFRKSGDSPLGAAGGVLGTVLRHLEDGSTHIGVATDHVIESFRNALWPGYKTGEGVDPTLQAQFQPLEDALTALGVCVWPMIEFEADDALAAAAARCGVDARVAQVRIWTPDKDLAQCVVGARIVQVDRTRGRVLDADAVRERFGVAPELIPDLLALSGDSSDGYPGIPGIGRVTAARLLTRHGPIERFPPEVLGSAQERALLFKRLATLRTDAAVLEDAEALRWRGARADFGAWGARLGDPRLVERAARVAYNVGRQGPHTQEA